PGALGQAELHRNVDRREQLELLDARLRRALKGGGLRHATTLNDGCYRVVPDHLFVVTHATVRPSAGSSSGASAGAAAECVEHEEQQAGAQEGDDERAEVEPGDPVADASGGGQGAADQRAED